jgi:5'-deoxynucleotidase YfbR-like HD superfamily hydrolase
MSHDTTTLADAVLHLGELALQFATINRTAVHHLDGETPESDSDHTVMLGWVACALAARCYPQLDVGLVAQLALVHDAPEVYAGDTSTLRIDDAGLAAKRFREGAAVGRLSGEFHDSLPWFPATILAYELGNRPEARFVRAVDKILCRIVHLLDGGVGLREHGVDRAEWDRLAVELTERIMAYASDFTELLALREELGRRITATPAVLTGWRSAMSDSEVRAWLLDRYGQCICPPDGEGCTGDVGPNDCPAGTWCRPCGHLDPEWPCFQDATVHSDNAAPTDERQLPTVYAFRSGSWDATDDEVWLAVADDGQVMAQHVSSNRRFGQGDVHLTFPATAERYRAKFGGTGPEFYHFVVLDDGQLPPPEVLAAKH